MQRPVCLQFAGRCQRVVVTQRIDPRKAQDKNNLGWKVWKVKIGACTNIAAFLATWWERLCQCYDKAAASPSTEPADWDQIWSAFLHCSHSGVGEGGLFLFVWGLLLLLLLLLLLFLFLAADPGIHIVCLFVCLNWWYASLQTGPWIDSCHDILYRTNSEWQYAHIRERERDGERDRERDRERERQRQRETERDRDRETQRDRERESISKASSPSFC